MHLNIDVTPEDSKFEALLIEGDFKASCIFETALMVVISLATVYDLDSENEDNHLILLSSLVTALFSFDVDSITIHRGSRSTNIDAESLTALIDINAGSFTGQESVAEKLCALNVFSNIF